MHTVRRATRRRSLWLQGNTATTPSYLPLGNLHNSARPPRRCGVALIGFLATPKTTREGGAFLIPRTQSAATRWVAVVDTIAKRYGLGPYLADNEEHALLACIVRNLFASAQFFIAPCAENTSDPVQIGGMEVPDVTLSSSPPIRSSQDLGGWMSLAS
ncbi:hypothetical protein L210DRAFT_3509212 [Boletus edulis BED1]|uniref:Uncharacterized protein n=1 Tax=Boletus edulis BED1 TaxID=1328754 RepID=A0AAD4BFT3_BOLED|nr:hypothetical protein L210DRAFT_3509212 [Boletus edulis BED1]